MDPAKPLIRNRASGRLDPGDADVVQVIHATARYGDLKRMGHVDFCLNGGHVQPFCANASSEYIIIADRRRRDLGRVKKKSRRASRPP